MFTKLRSEKEMTGGKGVDRGNTYNDYERHGRRVRGMTDIERRAETDDKFRNDSKSWNDNVNAAYYGGKHVEASLSDRRHYRPPVNRHSNRNGININKSGPIYNYDRPVTYEPRNVAHSSNRRYFRHRDPTTGRFIEASIGRANEVSEGEDTESSLSGRGFLAYLKDALGGYGSDNDKDKRSYNRSNNGSSKSRPRGTFENEYFVDRDEQFEDTILPDKFTGGDRRSYRTDFHNRYKNETYLENQHGPIDRSTRAGGIAPNDRNIYNDQRDDVTDRSNLRVPVFKGENVSLKTVPFGRAGGGLCGRNYGEGCYESCRRSLKTECADQFDRRFSSTSTCRPRSSSLKAGGMPRNRSSENVNDRISASGSRRPRARSAISLNTRSDRGRNNVRGNSYRERSVWGERRTDNGNARYREPEAGVDDYEPIIVDDIDESPVTRARFDTFREGRNQYTVPSEMNREPDNPDNDRPGFWQQGRSARRVDPIPDSERVIPPFIDGKISISKYSKLVPMERVMSNPTSTDAEREDAALSDKFPEFDGISAWEENSRPPYEHGNMYCAKPTGEATTWRVTAMQANAIVCALGKDSLRDSVFAMNMEPGTAAVFLVDAAMRIAAALHANPDESLPNENPLPEVFIKTPYFSAPLLLDGPTQPARGASSAVLRGSYGAVALWPEVRGNMFLAIRGYVRYALASMHRAEVYLTARICKKTFTLTAFDLKVMADTFTVSVAAAAVQLQQLYLLVVKSLHPENTNSLIFDMMDIKRYVRYPLGSKILGRTESYYLDGLDAIGDVSTGIPGLLLAAYVSFRTACTENISEMIEESDGDSDFELGGENSIAITVAAMLLQRYLGFLNKIAAMLVLAASYHGRDVEIAERALLVYKYICLVCAPLYRSVPVSEFEDDREKAEADLGLVCVDKEPSGNMATNTLTAFNASEISAIRISVNGTALLGKRVPLSEAMQGAKDILLGEEVVSAARAQVTGRRSIYGPRNERGSRTRTGRLM